MDQIIKSFLDATLQKLDAIDKILEGNPELALGCSTQAIGHILDGVEGLDATGALSEDIESGRSALEAKDTQLGREAIESAMGKLSL